MGPYLKLYHSVVCWRSVKDLNLRGLAPLLVFETSPLNQTWVTLRMAESTGLEPASEYKPAPAFQAGVLPVRQTLHDGREEGIRTPDCVTSNRLAGGRLNQLDYLSVWQGWRGLNSRWPVQSRLSCRWTTPQCMERPEGVEPSQAV